MSVALFDVSALESTEGKPVPWRDRKVLLICLATNGTVTHSGHTLGGKRTMLGTLAPGDLLLASWAGDWRAGVFVVADPEAVREALA